MMAFKRLGAADLAAATLTTLYTVPGGKEAVVTVSLCNRHVIPVSVRLALSATATPAAGEYLEYDVPIPASGVLERTGIAAEAGMKIVVLADDVGISAVAFGDESGVV